jgi:carboxylesterase type B
MYDGTGLVRNAIDFGKPYVFVAVNYRVAAWGFMPGKEILADGAANLGLLDQRMGLEWVQDNIAAFGGDPTKVTLWGESAGAISIFTQMALYDGDHTYNGKPLFRSAIMNSGSVIPVASVDSPKAQGIYDQVVAASSCAGSADTLSCLRSLPYDEFRAAANSVPNFLSYTSVALSYLPRPDGKVLTKSPHVLAASGKYAAVPMIIGDQEDEGPLFSLFQKNTTSTSAKLTDYLNGVLFTNAPRSVVEGLVNTYSSAVWDGSPFNTGLLNEIYPGFKRLSAILGDAVFTLTRRIFLRYAANTHPDVPAWSYIASYDYGTPILGTFHGSDLLQVFFGILPNYASAGIQKYYANFVYNQDPNNYSGGTSTKSKVSDNWPKWTPSGLKLIRFFSMFFTDLKDDFRSTQESYLVANIDDLRI